MDEKGKERKKASGTISSPGAHHGSLDIVDRRRRAEERKNILQLNPQPEVPSRGSNSEDKDKVTTSPSSPSNHTAGAYSSSFHASDRGKRKEERLRQTNSIQSSTPQMENPIEQDPVGGSYQVEATAVIKDDEADERVRRLEEQMAVMMQGAAPAVAVVNSNDTNEQSEDEFAGLSFCQRYRYSVLIGVALVAIGGGIAGYLLGTQASSPTNVPDSASGPSLTAVPTQAPVSVSTEPPLLDATERRSLVEAVLADLVPIIQPAALDWLSDVDTWQPENGTSNSSQQWIERYVMVALYYATNGANWRNNAGWLDINESVCVGWNGIGSCRNRLVADLNFASFRLAGTLPPEIGLLTALTRLVANNNEMVGPIPSQIGELVSLEQLLLHENGLSGSIPTEIGLLTTVSDLDLFANSLNGTIPTEIGNLRAIQELELERNTRLAGTIPTEIGMLTRLSQFTVYEANVGGSLPSEIGLATSLDNIELDNLPLQGSLPTEIGNLVKLQTLVMYSTRLSGEIPSEIGKLSRLTKLDLDDCFLTGEIPVEIFNLSNLKEIQLDFNELSGVLPPLPSSLSTCELNNNCFSNFRSAPSVCTVTPNCT